MSYIVSQKQNQTYADVPNHFKMVSSCLSAFSEVNDGKITVCLSQFLPGGGSDYENQGIETIFYVTSGEIDIKTESETIKLLTGDCFHSGPNTMMGLINNGTSSCEVLVILRPIN